ncbi:MAG: hypothetical protein LBF93_06370, partial [Zoogloeaceae bacterium]|nr:hypothetical protein [Zoogloeaceae bacterium]
PESLSEVFGETIRSLEAVIAGFETMQAAGINAGAVIEEALGKAIDKAQTRAEINAIIERINALQSAGKLSATEVDRLFSLLAQKGELMGAAMKKASDAAKNPADLNALADKIVKMGEEAKIAQPKMIDLFNEIRDRAKEAGGEALDLKQQIAGLLAQADRVRNAREQERSGDGAASVGEASQAASDAKFWSSAAKSAAMDGRAEQAAQYAEQARQSLEQAEAAAQRLGDKTPESMKDDIAEAKARALEAEAKRKRNQLEQMNAASGAQEEQLQALEQRLDDLIARAANGATLNVDARQATGQVDALKSKLDGLQDKTITVTTQYVSNGAPPAGTDATVRGFYPGGYTGDVGVSQIAGFVHGREHVTRAAMVAQPGARAFLDLFNRVGMAAIPAWLSRVKLPGYKTGGYVTPPQATAREERMIPAVFNFPGVGKVPAQLTPSVADELARALKIESLMRGRR